MKRPRPKQFIGCRHSQCFVMPEAGLVAIRTAYSDLLPHQGPWSYHTVRQAREVARRINAIADWLEEEAAK